MPTVDASRSLLAAGANYNAGDWANVGAETSLDFLATASLNRGVDIGIGVEALARLDGAIRQYIASDVNGQAHAAARVRAQVQMPLDLFDEAGVAVRLQAVAEAAAGVQLGIGLNIGDFLALAATDPRMRGVPIELLKINHLRPVAERATPLTSAKLWALVVKVRMEEVFVNNDGDSPGEPAP